MDGHDGTVWIRWGAGLGTVGLYALLKTGAGVRTPGQWFGWGAYCLGAILMAGVVLRSTGSFWDLLLFCGLGAIALLCATICAVRRPAAERFPGDWLWMSGSAAAVASILVRRGILWSGLLLISACCLGTARAWFARNQFPPETDETLSAPTGIRDFGLASLMWGLLTWGLLTAVQHARPDAWTSNVIALACGMLSLAVLAVVTREPAGRGLAGLGGLWLATLLVCSAGTDRRPGELLCLVVLGCTAVIAGIAFSALQLQSRSQARGDT